MTLFIDITKKEARVELRRGEEILGVRTWENTPSVGRDLLEHISEMLFERNTYLRDVKKIVVNPGPGHFSALRTGIVTATMLAFATGAELFVVGSDRPVDIIEPVYSDT